MPAVTQGRSSGHVVFTDNLFIDFEEESSSEVLLGPGCTMP
jgi:hypothetical protein